MLYFNGCALSTKFNPFCKVESDCSIESASSSSPSLSSDSYALSCNSVLNPKNFIKPCHCEDIFEALYGDFSLFLLSSFTRKPMPLKSFRLISLSVEVNLGSSSILIESVLGKNGASWPLAMDFLIGSSIGICFDWFLPFGAKMTSVSLRRRTHSASGSTAPETNNYSRSDSTNISWINLNSNLCFFLQ